MDRRDFIKTAAFTAAAVTLPMSTAEAVDVQIYESVTNTINKYHATNSDIYFHQYYQTVPYPRTAIWVWGPYGWTMWSQPHYFSGHIGLQDSIRSYDRIRKDHKRVKTISIHDAGQVYIYQDGTIKIFDKNFGEWIPHTPGYVRNLRRVDGYQRSRSTR